MALGAIQTAATPARLPGPRAASARAWLAAHRVPAALALGAALLAVTAARLPAAFESGNALNHVSGAWMTLADDLSRGTFYRPLLAPELGFGGTRFFPLAFVLHAALLRLGVPLLAAGYALSVAAGALLLAAAYLLLRRLGLRRPAAATFAALTLAGFAGQHALSAVRGDLLAVALEALGLALVTTTAATGRRPAGREVLLAAIAFTLAFAAKPTSLVAPAAAAAFLALARDRRAALALVLLTAGGAAAVVLATDALSGGRFLAILASCASGGAGPGDLVRAPFRLARAFALGDPAGLVLLSAALVALLLRAPRTATAWRAPASAAPAALLPALWLAAALGGLLLVMASPGTGVNHLLDVEVAAAVALGACAPGAGRGSRATRALPAAAALAGLALAVGLWREDLRTSRLSELRAILRAAPPGPILSEDPLVPLLAGARPVLLDPWMLRLAAEHEPALVRPLVTALREGAYPAVILFHDLASAEAAGWYAHGNLGRAPIEEVRTRYRPAARAGRYHLYVPAPRQDARGRRVVVTGPAGTSAEPLDWPSPPAALDSGPHAPALPDRPGRAVAAPGAPP